MFDISQEKEIPYEITERGVYHSLLEDHPGFVRFPVPLTGAHYKAWIKEDEQKIEGEAQMWKDWRKALALISEWGIPSVKQSDLTPDADNVPLEVIHWVRLVSSLYILDAISLKNLRAPSET